MRRALRVIAALAFLYGGAAATLGMAPASAAVVHSSLGRFTGADAPGGPFGVLLPAVAVDASSGDVWVLESNFAEFGKGVVDEFTAEGAYAGVQIAGSETPRGSFAFGLFSSGVAVDNSLGANQGDVYVADTEHGVVDRFSSSGVFLCQITGRTPVGAEEIEHECSGVLGSETPDGSIAPAGLAVDSGGDVYVADGAHAVVDEFTAAGAYLRQISDPHLSTEMTSLAVDAVGDVYVTNYHVFGDGSGTVAEFAGEGAFVRLLDTEGGAAAGVSVDPGTGHLYATVVQGSEGEVAEYESSGALIDTFGRTGVAQMVGIAVNGTTGDVYTTEGVGFNGGGVFRFGPDRVVPTVSVSSATGVDPTGAMLHGQVDPDTAHGGTEVTGCQFEYGTTTGYGQTAPCAPAPSYASPSPVTAEVALEPGTLYHFRLSATSAGGTNSSPDESFTTPGPPRIDATGSRSAGPHSATLTAQVNPFDFATTCSAQYVDAATFASSGYAHATTVPCAPAELAAGFGDQSVLAPISGLSIDTTYHFRFTVTSEGGSETSADRTFATFGIASFQVSATDEHGAPVTQAGSHPWALTTSFQLNETATRLGETHAVGANMKDVVTDLPPGIVGDVDALPRCTRYEVLVETCSPAAQIGMLYVRQHAAGDGEENNAAPLYNVVPPAGEPAEFGALVDAQFTAFITANVRTGGDYGVRALALNVTTTVGITGVTVALWGVPADPSHDIERVCPNSIRPCPTTAPLRPFLTLPSACVGPLNASIKLDSWQAPGEFISKSTELPAITGCERLGFDPALTVQPETTVADTPSGLAVDLQLPQNENPAGLAEADLKRAVVTLPAGVSLNPGAAAGLAACSPAQFGREDAEAPTCPDASRIGTVEVHSPLLGDPLTGYVYAAAQNDNPFGSVLAIYLAAEADGARVKLAGRVESNPETGQLTTTFDDNPQLPFSDLKLNLFGGPRGVLATPEACGAYTTEATFSPWSGTAPVALTNPFPVDGGCASGFAPSFSAGSTNLQAGAYTPFVASFSRQDQDHELGGLSVSLPPGLAAVLAGVPECDAAAANAGTCPEAARVGSVTAGAGPGPDPLFVNGRVYLTGPYDGGPFGLAVVVPAVAGPFDFGNVVIRQSLRVDPRTAQVTDVSDPLPTMLRVRGADGQLAGVPIRLRRVDVAIDRPGFAFNPTSCARMAVAGTLASAEGAGASVASPFQVAGCAGLRFAPKFSASTDARTSRANGAALRVKLTYPAGSLGKQANIKSAKVQLPKSLPSRLTTLRKACVAKVFEANPASCPAESIVGHAVVHTQVLPVPLEGPAYFVSHGGEAFPNLTLMLQGDGVTVELVGDTLIKGGVTSSTFASTPDVPIENFELTLPRGPYSALAANDDLCRQRLAMPTAFVAQNGATLDQSTRIEVQGCPEALRVLSKRVARRTATVKLYVPAAGTVKLAGRGLRSKVATATGRETLTLSVGEARAGRLRTRLRVVFTPASGKARKRQVRAVGLRFGR
jgi:hypothetical protein